MNDSETTTPITTKLLDVDGLADLLNVPKDTIYRWRRKGYGPRAIRLGKHLRWDVNVVREWLDTETESEAA